jgi:hypothetical protein
MERVNVSKYHTFFHLEKQVEFDKSKQKYYFLVWFSKHLEEIFKTIILLMEGTKGDINRRKPSIRHLNN